jgi:predicted RNA-binding protein
MCQVSVFLDQEKIAENVIWIEPINDGIEIKTFFDDPVRIKGAIKSIDLIKNRVILTSEQDSLASN